MEGPGYLAVAIQPGWNTDPEIFEDWYKTEHGPLRLRLPFITTGDRYAALDGRKPAWSAVYDVTELAHLESRIYTRLREERSQREMAVMGTFESLDRKIYSLISSRGESRGPAPVTIAISVRILETDLDAYKRFYEDEHTPMMSKVPGWIRTRRFRMVAGGIDGMPPAGQVECLVVHDFEKQNGIEESAEFKAAENTPAMAAWSGKFLSKDRRAWYHYFTFDALTEPPETVITTDSAHLRYRLDGKPEDPVVVCVNSILTDYTIWDAVTAALTTGIPDATGKTRTFRVLRYNPRGYSEQDEKSNHTHFDLLADDLEYLLQRLEIPRAHAVLGVSMGGVTALNFAIRHPEMLAKFIACDCNVAASPANNAAWASRVQLAHEKGMPALATATVERWFTEKNHGSAEAKRVTEMVAKANVDGFEQNTGALGNYDIREKVKEIKVPGLLVAGEQDGKIPEAMKGFGIPGAEFKGIPEAGHLPMLENHDAFMKVLGDFL